MKVVGLTGGIACGKSTVGAMFKEEKGVVVIDLDQLARQVVEPHTKLFRRIVQHFGEEVVTEEGTLDRKKLAAIIFADRQQRKWLDKATLPAILRKLLLLLFWCFVVRKSRSLPTTTKQKGEELVIVEAPLLFETGMQRWVNSVVVVAVPKELQLQRLMSRDEAGQLDAQQRIQSQMDIDLKVKRADFVVDNSSDFQHTKKQVHAILKQLRQRKTLVTRSNAALLILCLLLGGCYALVRVIAAMLF
ncbi:Dephospho-CoA kinase cab5 [Balamuthia mandrillaris]